MGGAARELDEARADLLYIVRGHGAAVALRVRAAGTAGALAAAAPAVREDVCAALGLKEGSRSVVLFPAASSSTSAAAAAPHGGTQGMPGYIAVLYDTGDLGLALLPALARGSRSSLAGSGLPVAWALAAELALQASDADSVLRRRRRGGGRPEVVGGTVLGLAAPGLAEAAASTAKSLTDFVVSFRPKATKTPPRVLQQAAASPPLEERTPPAATAVATTVSTFSQPPHPSPSRVSVDATASPASVVSAAGGGGRLLFADGRGAVTGSPIAQIRRPGESVPGGRGGSDGGGAWQKLVAGAYSSGSGSALSRIEVSIVSVSTFVRCSG